MGISYHWFLEAKQRRLLRTLVGHLGGLSVIVRRRIRTCRKCGTRVTMASWPEMPPNHPTYSSGQYGKFHVAGNSDWIQRTCLSSPSPCDFFEVNINSAIIHPEYTPWAQDRYQKLIYTGDPYA